MSQPQPGLDELAVRAVVSAVSDAWAENDATAFVDHYGEHATAILPEFHLKNREDIRSSMAEAFNGPLKGSRRVHRVQSVRFLDAAAGNAAVVISQSGTIFPGEAEPPAERWSLATWLLSRHDGGWRIEAYHDCPAGVR